MATTIRDLLVRLGVDTGDSQSAVDGLESSIGDLKDVMVGAVVAVGSFVASLVGLAATSAAAGDAIDKGATAATISTDAYQELAFAASQAGTSIEVVTKAMGKQVAAAGQLRDGVGGAGEALADLGIAYADIEGLSADEQFAITAQAISELGTEQEMLAAATAIYGEDMAQQLLPMLSGGAAGLEEMAEMAHQLGLVMSEEAIAASVEFTDTWDQVWSLLKGVRNTIGVALLPVITEMLGKIRDWYTANRVLIATKLEAWLQVIVSAMEGVGRVMSLVNDTVVSVFGGWGPILAAAAGLMAFVGAAVAGLAALKAWVAIQGVIAAIGAVGGVVFLKIIAIILAVTAVVVGLALVIDDLIVFFRGGDSALGRFLDKFREADGFLGGVARTIETLISVGSALFGVVVRLGEIWWAVFSRTALPAIKLLAAAWLFFVNVGMAAMGVILDNVLIPLFDDFIVLLGHVMAALDALQPGIDFVLDGLDAILGGISAITGVDLSFGGGDEEGGEGGAPSLFGDDSGDLFADTGAGAASSEAFAPTTTEALGGAAAFGAGAAASTSTDVTVQGSSYSISGVGWTEEAILDLIRNAENERARATSSALEGAEV